jgi:hypothetical protein
MEVPGEQLTGVLDGLEFVEETKTESLNQARAASVSSALVTAIDCATIARRPCQRVTMIYRRSEARCRPIT